jgi:hypothetical protein
MIISSNAFLKNLAVHRITDAGLTLSNQPIQLDDEFTKEVLLKYFFKSFKDDPKFEFSHHTSLDLNDVYSCVSKIFGDPSTLFEHSDTLARLLFESSSHPNIKPGDFFTAYIEDVVLDDEIIEVVGLFKAENMDTFLKVMPNQNVFDINTDKGININKLDKGALIFNAGKESGYVVLLVDNTNKDNGAQYWKDEFLKVKPSENEFYKTQELINMCQDFVLESVPEEDKAERISLVNESMNFLKKNDTFDKYEFEQTVLKEPALIDAFNTFQEETHPEVDFSKEEAFNISDTAIKQTKRFIKSVIKLDKNFHVYVHGNKENIEKGFDDSTNKNYYKLYFEEES